MLEIERKFLVKNHSFKDNSFSNKRITQGYLNSEPSRTVRVRIYGDQGFLTIKGAADAGGTTRFEWEKEIELQEAEKLLNLSEPGSIDKIRYLFKAGDKTFEIDEFFGENEGLLVAEIELNAADEEFEKPDWLGAEVTGDAKYYNSQLGKRPFSTWP
ncbi:CYTH domain-containing protein [Flavimarina sp. Hel_I_48]|uniref:CYTH domain-containing protein n=1 Tax=Flavimarina sp. Hel_I_48 TaxID=1392488 RepID=UPI0004DF65A2|nr:CYTH domain-containing protein [Flavimarina sp. Hel_I_48]